MMFGILDVSWFQECPQVAGWVAAWHRLFTCSHNIADVGKTLDQISM